MLVGVPKEIKNHEYRVGMTPGGVRELVRHGHAVIVQKNAGNAIGLRDEQYSAAGAELADSAEEVFERAQLIVKVKEPQPDECRRLRPEQTLFTYLHLAADKTLTEALLAQINAGDKLALVAWDKDGEFCCLTLVKANGTETLQAIFKKAGMPEKSWPSFAIMNGRELAAVPPAGTLVKAVK